MEPFTIDTLKTMVNLKSRKLSAQWTVEVDWDDGTAKPLPSDAALGHFVSMFGSKK